MPSLSTAAVPAALVVALLPLARHVSAQTGPLPMKLVVAGVELHYIERGQGEPVILLHGGQGDYRAWPALIESLATRYRVISYSRRYHWPNDNAIAGTDHSALVDARDLGGLVDALRLGPVHLVGTSYGAFTALAFAVSQPDRVRSMVLAEPPVHPWVTGTPRGAALFDERETSVYTPARAAFAAGRDEAAMRMFIDSFDGHGTFDALPPERRAAIMANARFFKALSASSNPFPNLSKAAAGRLPMPVLVVRGAETDELHRLVAEEAGRVLRKAQRFTVPNAGHGSPRQNPEAFNRAVAEFLDRHRAPPR